MLSALGGLGLGLVWGWLAWRRLRVARWPLALIVLLLIAVQALLVIRVGERAVQISFLAGLALGALLARAWLRGLALRYGEPASGE